MKTEREFQLSLGKLLNQVRISNNWSAESFISNAKTSGVSKSEAYRFFKALVEMNLLKRDKKRRCAAPNFNVNIWQNEDRKMMLVKDIMDMFPNLQQKRGPKQIVVQRKQIEKRFEQTTTEEGLIVNNLAQFSAEDLVQELRSRGYEVNCSRTIVETL